MSYSKRSRYSCSPSPYRRFSSPVSRSMSRSRSISRSRSRSRDPSVENPGNNLYVTGLSTQITKRDVEKHFSTEGKVEDVHLVVDPWTRDSRGFGFVTMSTLEEADRCIKYLDRSVLEGRVITVEKAKRRRGRTPTPGRYLGLRTISVRHRSRSCSANYGSRSPSYSYESYRSRSRSRSYSPYYHRRRSYSPYHTRGRSFSRSRSPYSLSPISRRDRSYSPYYSRDYSPKYHYYRRSRYRSISQSLSPRSHRYSRRSYSRSVSPGRSRRSYARNFSRRRSRRSYSRSVSPWTRRSSRRGYSRSISPRPRRSSRRSISGGSAYKRGDSRDRYCYGSYKRSPSASVSSGSVSRSVTPRSPSPSR